MNMIRTIHLGKTSCILHPPPDGQLVHTEVDGEDHRLLRHRWWGWQTLNFTPVIGNDPTHWYHINEGNVA